MIVEIEGIPLHLAHPDELSVTWVGQEEVMRQLLAAWLVIDAQDLPMGRFRRVGVLGERIIPVVGHDGRPTFDARHVAQHVEQAEQREGERGRRAEVGEVDSLAVDLRFQGEVRRVGEQQHDAERGEREEEHE